MPVDVRYYTDPACSVVLGHRAAASPAHVGVRRWAPVLVGDGRARALLWADYRRHRVRGRRGHEPVRRPDGSVAGTAAESGMPVDARLWSQNPIASTYPACQAVKAAAEQGPDAAYRYLRRLREGLMTERKKLDHTEALVGEAGPAGLDVDRFRIDLALERDHRGVRRRPRRRCAIRPRRRREQGRVSEDRGPASGSASPPRVVPRRGRRRSTGSGAGALRGLPRGGAGGGAAPAQDRRRSRLCRSSGSAVARPASSRS